MKLQLFAGLQAKWLFIFSLKIAIGSNKDFGGAGNAICTVLIVAFAMSTQYTIGQEMMGLSEFVDVPAMDPSVRTTLKQLKPELLRPSTTRYGASERIELRNAFKTWNVEILFDEKSLSDESISSDELVSRPVIGQTLFDYLNTSLQSLELTWMPIGGYIWVSTKQQQSNIVAIYEVSDLKSFKYGSVPLMAAIEACIAPDHWVSAGGEASHQFVPIGNRHFIVISAPYETQRQVNLLFTNLSRKTNAFGVETVDSMRSNTKKSTVRRSHLKKAP